MQSLQCHTRRIVIELARCIDDCSKPDKDAFNDDQREEKCSMHVVTPTIVDPMYAMYAQKNKKPQTAL